MTVWVSSESKASDILSFDAAIKKPTDIKPDTAGDSGDWFGGSRGRYGGDNNNRNKDEGRELTENKEQMALSMSQYLTLGYAALVGVGGLMGYLKRGSQTSLLSGGTSASILYYVYTQLPTNPVFASSLGFGVSAALLGAMGYRFKKSGKMFPAGVVSIVSLVMAGFYVHGITRSVGAP